MVPPVGLSPTSLPSNGEALVFELQQYIKETPVFQDLHSRVGNNGIEPLFQPENGCVLTLDEFPKLPCLHKDFCSGGWNRTTDLKVMSLASYHCSTPQVEKRGIDPLFQPPTGCVFNIRRLFYVSQDGCSYLFYMTPVYMVVICYTAPRLGDIWCCISYATRCLTSSLNCICF